MSYVENRDEALNWCYHQFELLLSGEINDLDLTGVLKELIRLITTFGMDCEVEEKAVKDVSIALRDALSTKLSRDSNVLPELTKILITAGVSNRCVLTFWKFLKENLAQDDVDLEIVGSIVEIICNGFDFSSTRHSCSVDDEKFHRFLLALLTNLLSKLLSVKSHLLSVFRVLVFSALKPPPAMLRILAGAGSSKELAHVLVQVTLDATPASTLSLLTKILPLVEPDCVSLLDFTFSTLDRLWPVFSDPKEASYDDLLISVCVHMAQFRELASLEQLLFKQLFGDGSSSSVYGALLAADSLCFIARLAPVHVLLTYCELLAQLNSPFSNSLLRRLVRLLPPHDELNQFIKLHMCTADDASGLRVWTCVDYGLFPEMVRRQVVSLVWRQCRAVIGGDDRARHSAALRCVTGVLSSTRISRREVAALLQPVLARQFLPLIQQNTGRLLLTCLLRLLAVVDPGIVMVGQLERLLEVLDVWFSDADQMNNDIRLSFASIEFIASLSRVNPLPDQVKGKLCRCLSALFASRNPVLRWAAMLGFIQFSLRSSCGEIVSAILNHSYRQQQLLVSFIQRGIPPGHVGAKLGDEIDLVALCHSENALMVQRRAGENRGNQASSTYTEAPTAVYPSHIDETLEALEAAFVKVSKLIVSSDLSLEQRQRLVLALKSHRSSLDQIISD